MSRRRLFSFLVVVATAVLVCLVLTDWLPILRGPAPDTSEWHWRYRPRPLNRWWAALSAATLTFLIAAWWLRQRSGKRWITITAVSGLALGSLLLQLGLLYADRPNLAAELIDRALAVQTNGYFWTAAQVDDLNTLLRNYPAAMDSFESDHARTHPPGLVVANRLTMAALARAPRLSETIARTVWPLRCTDLWLLDQPAYIVAAAGVWALLPLILAATAVFPAYALARQLAGPGEARLMTAMMAALPALLLFAPLPDQIYPLLTLLIMLTLHLGLSRQRSAWFFASGLLLSMSSFLTLGNATLLLVVVIYVALVIWQKPTLKHRPSIWLRWGALFFLGAASIWLLYWLVWGVSPWAIAQASIVEHYALVTSQRNYRWWLLYNLVDLFTFVGVPVLSGFIVATIMAVRGLWRRRASTTSAVTTQLRHQARSGDRPEQLRYQARSGDRPEQSPSALALSVALLIIILDISGSTRGEVGRIWLFFMPLIVIAGSAFLAQWEAARRTPLLYLGLQLVAAVSLGLAWRPVGATIAVAERPSMPAPPHKITPLDVAFGDTITLQGYTLTTQEDRLDLTLQWQASGAAARPYTVFTHFINAQGALVTQQDNWPVNGQWPPTCWRSGDVVVDPYRIELSADLPPGEYSLLVGMYDARNNTRLPTAAGEDAIHLANVTIVPNP